MGQIFGDNGRECKVFVIITNIYQIEKKKIGEEK